MIVYDIGDKNVVMPVEHTDVIKCTVERLQLRIDIY